MFDFIDKLTNKDKVKDLERELEETRRRRDELEFEVHHLTVDKKYFEGSSAAYLQAAREAQGELAKRGVKIREVKKVKRVPVTVREFIFQRDNRACVQCGETEGLEIDHIFPKSRGGTNDVWNLQTLCGPCNREKGDLAPG